MKPPKKQATRIPKATVTLRSVAEAVGLTASTVSAVLNNSAASKSVPEHTKKRILDAARALDYRPNFFARSLRVQRTYMIGVILEEIGDAYGSLVISGIERYLRQRNVFFLTVAHRHDKKLLESYSTVLRERGAEGFITVDTLLTEEPALPTVAVAGHGNVKGVTNIILDHHQAALQALNHLVELGHEKIAFMKGSKLSSDSGERWNAICEVAANLGIRMPLELILKSRATTRRQISATRSPSNYCNAISRLLPFSPITTFPRSAPSALSRKQDFGFPTTFRSWVSMTSRVPPT